MYWWILLFAIILLIFGNQNHLFSADVPENAPTNISAKNHIDEVTLFEEPFEDVNWHPHEFHFVTDVDPAYIGPAHTHLTFYYELIKLKLKNIRRILPM